MPRQASLGIGELWQCHWKRDTGLIYRNYQFSKRKIRDRVGTGSEYYLGINDKGICLGE